MNPLREPLSPEQAKLIQVIFEPFDQNGWWAVWQYVDLTLDRLNLDAADVLASLPSTGDRAPTSPNYGLTWRQDPHMQPRQDSRVALTVAGLRHLPEAEPLLAAFLTMIRHLVDRQRDLIPSPDKVVEAEAPSAAIADQVLTASIGGSSAPPVDAAMGKLRQLLKSEPFLHSVTQQSVSRSEEWTVRVPAALREYRDVTTIDEYLDRVVELVAPNEPPSVPHSFAALDIPYAAGYLDAAWKSRTGSHLFANLDPASVARLTQACSSEEEFHSLMSALADVLGQVITPGKTTPPKGGALEAVQSYLVSSLDAEPANRVSTAIAALIHLRHIRVAAQHSDARHRAVTAFQEIGLPFPPVSWEQAWAHVARLAKGALDALREEIQAGIR